MTDHVFKEKGDGSLEFVGDFDAVYNSERDPWGQSGFGDRAKYYHQARNRIADVLRSSDIEGKGLEAGCGLGYALRAIAYQLWRIEWTGLDVSDVAIAKARLTFPDLKFVCANLTDYDPPGVGYDVIVMNQMLWYVAERFDETIDRCHALLNDRGCLLIAHGFINGPQRYADHLNGFHGTLAWLVSRYPEKFTLIDARYDDRGKHDLNDGIFLLRKRPC